MELMVELPTGGYDFARYVDIQKVGGQHRVTQNRPESRAKQSPEHKQSNDINIIENTAA